MTEMQDEINKTQKAAVAVGLEILDQLEGQWYELEQQGYVFEDVWYQTIKDVINGEYFE